MKTLPVIFLIFLSFCVRAQTGDMRVYTVAGSLTDTALGDGGPATAASLSATEGVWMDGVGNVYISDLGHNRIRKVTASTGIISTIAGTGVAGYSGDNGPASSAKINKPYGLYADQIGNVYFADISNNVVRKINAMTGTITTIAGGGSSLGDGSPATNAQLNAPQNVYLDSAGNIYIGEIGRIRKINGTTNIITTIAGNGIQGLSGDGGPATLSQIMGAAGMAIDMDGNFIFSDRGNSRVRKIDFTNGIITTIAGTNIGLSGDGGPATDAQLAGTLGLALDSMGNIIIADNGNNFIRKVNIVTGIITTIAGVGNGVVGSYAEGASASVAEIHPEFLYLDRSKGTIYYSNWNTQIHKITGYDARLSYSNSLNQIEDSDPNLILFPNPTLNSLTIKNENEVAYKSLEVTNCLGLMVMKQNIFPTKEIYLNIQGFCKGIYFITLRTQSNAKVLKFEKL